MTLSREDAQRRKLEAQLAACLRVVNQATAQLEGFHAAVGPVEADVARLIGGTAQGTDAAMVKALSNSKSAVTRAIAACTHAKARARGAGWA